MVIDDPDQNTKVHTTLATYSERVDGRRTYVVGAWRVVKHPNRMNTGVKGERRKQRGMASAKTKPRTPYIVYMKTKAASVLMRACR